MTRKQPSRCLGTVAVAAVAATHVRLQTYSHRCCRNATPCVPAVAWNALTEPPERDAAACRWALATRWGIECDPATCICYDGRLNSAVARGKGLLREFESRRARLKAAPATAEEAAVAGVSPAAATAASDAVNPTSTAVSAAATPSADMSVPADAERRALAAIGQGLLAIMDDTRLSPLSPRRLPVLTALYELAADACAGDGVCSALHAVARTAAAGKVDATPSRYGATDVAGPCSGCAADVSIELPPVACSSAGGAAASASPATHATLTEGLPWPVLQQRYLQSIRAIVKAAFHPCHSLRVKWEAAA